MSAQTRNFTLADDRQLDVLLGGDDDGFPLLMHHGSPSDSTTYADWHDDCRARGLRLVCLSRPGYATSTRAAGRNVAQAASDSAELLDQLGYDAFVTGGWSGGGPHALACAALLAERCLAAFTLAGVGPNGQEDLDFVEGMGPENLDEFAAALKGEAALREWKAEFGEPFRHVTADEIADALGGLVSDIDREELTGGYAAVIAASTRRALESGFDGWVDDDLAFTKPWGFNVEDITTPVTVWQGDLDLMVPFSHGQWLVRHLPNATPRLVPGQGHISLGTRFRGSILDELASARHG